MSMPDLLCKMFIGIHAKGMLSRIDKSEAFGIGNAKAMGIVHSEIPHELSAPLCSEGANGGIVEVAVGFIGRGCGGTEDFPFVSRCQT